MKRLIILLCATILAVGVQAKTPTLRFSKDGKFRIAQFTDVHFDLGSEERRAEAEKTIAQMRTILDEERPDFVMFTGDIVTGKPAAEGWTRVLEQVVKRHIPFCVTLGNHDPEQDLTRAEIAKIVTKHKGTLNTMHSGVLDDVTIEVMGDNGKPAFMFYCMDSNDYATVEGMGGYGWFRPEQLAWYRTQSAKAKENNGGNPLSALAFFHIPLPEFGIAWRDTKNSRTGRAAENECPGAVNAGMFAAMAECGDVVGMFVGHDHDIDYVVAEKGIAMGYGRFSGDNTTYNNLRHGIRLLELTEGVHGFETWIRERDGRVVDRVRMVNGKIEKIKK